MTENKQPKENPQMETQPEAPQVQPEDKAAELLKALETVGIDSAEKVQSTYQASAQTGQMANLLGEERKRTQELERRLAQIEQQQRQPRQEDYGYYDTPNQSAGLTADQVEAAARKVLGEYVHSQQQAQLATAQEFSRIQGDQDFPAVRSIWEKHLQNPNVQLALQSGQTNLQDQYNTVVRGYYKGLLMQSKDTIQGYVQKTQPRPPHMEQQNNAAPAPEQKTGERPSLQEIMGKSTGGDEDINNALKALFPDTDPMFRA